MIAGRIHLVKSADTSLRNGCMMSAMAFAKSATKRKSEKARQHSLAALSTSRKTFNSL